MTLVVKLIKICNSVSMLSCIPTSSNVRRAPIQAKRKKRRNGWNPTMVYVRLVRKKRVVSRWGLSTNKLKLHPWLFQREIPPNHFENNNRCEKSLFSNSGIWKRKHLHTSKSNLVKMGGLSKLCSFNCHLHRKAAISRQWRNKGFPKTLFWNSFTTFSHKLLISCIT